MSSAEHSPCDSTSNSPPSYNCLVCGRKANSTNYGIISCRACAKFFHRTQSIQKYYVCRQGDGKCEINKDLPCLCRRCRIDKCLAVGMRHPKKRRNSKRSECQRSDDGDNMDNGYINGTQLPIDEQGNSYEIPRLENSLVNGILKRINRAVSVFYEKRRKYETELWETLRYGDECVTALSGETFHVSNVQFCSEMFPFAVREFRKMYDEAFPEFNELSEQEKTMVIISTAGSAFVFETSYLAHKNFPNSDRYSFISTTSLMDHESCLSFFPFHDMVVDQEALSRATRFYSDKMHSIIYPAIREAELTETEYHATMCILLCSFDFSPWMDPRIVEIGRTIKNEVFTELNLYYKNVLKCEDMASRLGRLMTCVYAAQEAGVLRQEKLQTFKLMGAYKEDDLIFQFFLS